METSKNRRIQFGQELKEVTGLNDVYYQRPRNTGMTYPAIVYSKENIYSAYADNKTYFMQTQYNVQIMDTDPDSDIAEKLLDHFPYARANRRYLEDSIYHDVLIIYY